jgi:hypothetical protein
MMTKDEALKKLEALKPELKKRKEAYEKVEKDIAGDESLKGTVCGPRNEEEYQDMLKDIKESGDE